MSTTAAQAPIAASIAVPRPNTVLQDLEDAIETYPQTYLTVDIYDVSFPDDFINEGDNCTFRIRVRNDGPLHVNDLTLLISGVGGTGTKVGKHGWSEGQSTFETPAVDLVPAHMEDDAWVEVPDTSADHFHFWAGPPRATSDLVRVSVNDFDLDLDHLLKGHSDPVQAANDVFRGEVFPK